MKPKKNVVITGSSGFIGSKLVKCFEDNGWLVHRFPSISHEISLINDVVDNFFSALNDKVDLIVHCAGVLNSKFPEQFVIDSNVNFTTVLAANYLSRNPNGHFIFLSSFSVFEASEQVINSNSLSAPSSLYGISKMLAEEALYELTKMHPSASILSLRPPVVFGSGHKSFLRFIDIFVERGFPLPLKGFDIKRAMVSLEDLANFIVEMSSGLQVGFNVMVPPCSNLSIAQYLYKANHTSKRHFYLFWVPSVLFKILFFISNRPEMYRSLSKPVSVAVEGKPFHVISRSVFTKLSGAKQ